MTSAKPRQLRMAAWLCAAAASLGSTAGCSTWNADGLAAEEDQRLRVLVLPVRWTVEITSLSDIMTVPEGDPPADEAERIEAQIAHVSEELTGAIAGALDESDTVHPVRFDGDAEALPTEIREITPDRAADIGEAYDADAILAVNLAGYGTLGEKWKRYAIASGVAEGTTEGVVVGVVTGIPALGLAVAVEEIIRDSIMAVGGVSAYNAAYAPVVMEATLVSTADGSTVWAEDFHAIDEEDENEEEVAALTEEDKERREVHLQITADKVVQELTATLTENVRDRQLAASPATAAARAPLSPTAMAGR